ncbi:hypothetical protein [Haloferula sargassicola]|uniref:Uncharacterized protein n=1 Tax=Haloferula sargassicola TaxID=490096 RepID=A0ABP9UR05_9BACT
MNNDPLDDLLRAAAQEPPLSEGFRSEVWTRIAYAEQRSVASWFHRALASLVRPLPAALTVAATVVIGAWLGLASTPTAEDAQLSYAESISPFSQEHTP